MGHETGEGMHPIFPNVDVAKVNEAATYILDIFIVIWAIAFLMSFMVLLHSLITTRRWHLVKLLKCLLPWPLLAREVDFITHFNTDYLSQQIAHQDVPTIFTSALPGYLLFSIFLLLVLFWVYLFHLSSANMKSFISRMLITYFCVNILVYAAWFFLLFLMIMFPAYLDTIHMCEGIYAATLDLLVATIFFFYGIRLLSALRNNEYVSFITKRIFVLTLFCTILFCWRSLWIVMDEFTFSDPLVNLFGVCVNTLVCELLPISFILLVLCWPTHRIALTRHETASEYPPLHVHGETTRGTSVNSFEVNH